MTRLNIEMVGQGLSDRQGGLHLGMQHGSEVVEPVPAMAGTVTFALSVDVIAAEDGGAFDLRGPYVHGKCGDRFLYLSWGDLDRDGAFGMAMRTKIKLQSIPPDLITRALKSDSTLRRTLSLVDVAGNPVSGTIPPERIHWSIVATSGPG